MKKAPIRTIDDLKADPNNPRSMDENTRDSLGFSLEEFGDISGIVFNLRTQQLVSGHQRVEALKIKFGKMAVKHYDGTYWLEGKGQTKFPIRMVDWAPKLQRAASLTANNPALAGEFTADMEAQIRALVAEDEALAKSLLLDALLPPLPDEPDFEPGSAADQGQLDQKKPHVCPKCGHSFVD